MISANLNTVLGYYRPFFFYAYRRSDSVNPACEAR